MDPKKHPLVEVEELLTSLWPADPGMYSLHVYHHELNCCRCNFAPTDSFPIARINASDINDGLTREMWDRIEAQIRTLIKQGVIEWQTQKP